jgi:hypothetical protein
MEQSLGFEVLTTVVMESSTFWDILGVLSLKTELFIGTPVGTRYWDLSRTPVSHTSAT